MLVFKYNSKNSVSINKSAHHSKNRKSMAIGGNLSNSGMSPGV
jgi:hypothetical protein